jgi:hypothetical protein
MKGGIEEIQEIQESPPADKTRAGDGNGKAKEAKA